MNKKIAICSTDSSPSSLIDGRFGRCKYFMLWDTIDKQYEPLANTGPGAEHGAGTGAVQALMKNQVGFVISQRVGPKAYEALKSAGIKIFAISDGKTVEEALKSFQDGELREITAPSN